MNTARRTAASRSIFGSRSAALAALTLAVAAPFRAAGPPGAWSEPSPAAAETPVPVDSLKERLARAERENDDLVRFLAAARLEREVPAEKRWGDLRRSLAGARPLDYEDCRRDREQRLAVAEGRTARAASEVRRFAARERRLRRRLERLAVKRDRHRARAQLYGVRSTLAAEEQDRLVVRDAEAPSEETALDLRRVERARRAWDRRRVRHLRKADALEKSIARTAERLSPLEAPRREAEARLVEAKAVRGLAREDVALLRSLRPAWAEITRRTEEPPPAGGTAPVARSAGPADAGPVRFPPASAAVREERGSRPRPTSRATEQSPVRPSAEASPAGPDRPRVPPPSGPASLAAVPRRSSDPADLRPASPARPVPAAASPVPRSLVPSDNMESAGFRRHRVARGETLLTVAARYYGDPARWEALYAANRYGIRKGLLEAGQWLVVPRIGEKPLTGTLSPLN